MKATVLVIEDNTDNMALFSYLLASAGHRVVEAVDGASGVEIAEREAPDLVVRDVRMPVMDGFEVVRKLRNNISLKHVPVMAVTASVALDDRDKAMTAGFDCFVEKPIDPESFLDQVAALLRGRP